MRILALEPYYGGSHRAFLDGWQKASRHHWTVLGLPPHQWKWRMRHGAVTLAERVRALAGDGEAWDVVFCSAMLNLAEFKGLVGRSVAALPTIAYFHENQLTYPVRHEDERDLHFAFTNFTTALAADQVWLNSRFHLESFHSALSVFLSRMPDFNALDKVDILRHRSSVKPQGIDRPKPRSPQPKHSAHLLWAARWEHDKNPGLFFEAMKLLLEQGADFRVSVIGQQFSEAPAVFAQARAWLGARILHWGFQEAREAYESALAEADIFVSTADHEFFGVSTVEAIAAGAYPLLPNRLAYPEILNGDLVTDPGRFFYDGSVTSLVARLHALILRVDNHTLWPLGPDELQAVVSRFYWDTLAPQLDDALASVPEGRRP